MKRYCLVPGVLAVSAVLGIVALPVRAQENSDHGKAIYGEKCASCHAVSAGQGEQSERVAPPIFGVKDHYLDAYANREAFVSAVSAWVLHPDEEKALMKGAIGNFGIMPPVEITPEEAKMVAGYIFDEAFEKPDWYSAHKEKEHGGFFSRIWAWFGFGHH